jgi:hypothetical protein
MDIRERHPQRSAEDLVTAKKPVGRPKGEPSTI